jgi:hypothetical protein
MSRELPGFVKEQGGKVTTWRRSAIKAAIGVAAPGIGCLAYSIGQEPEPFMPAVVGFALLAAGAGVALAGRRDETVSDEAAPPDEGGSA